MESDNKFISLDINFITILLQFYEYISMSTHHKLNDNRPPNIQFYKIDEDDANHCTRTLLDSIRLNQKECEIMFYNLYTFDISNKCTKIFCCDSFCKMTVSIPKQTVSDPDTIQHIKDICRDTLHQSDINSVEKISLAFSSFIEYVINSSKKMLTKDPDLILTKIPKTAEVSLQISNIYVDVEFLVSDLYFTDKASGKSAANKFKELTGSFPKWDSWKVIEETNIPLISMNGLCIR